MVSAAEPGPSSVGSGVAAQRGKSRPSGRSARGSGTDPLAAVLTLGGRHNGVGLAIGLAGALFVHGAGAATSLQQLFELEDFAGAIYEDIETELRGVYDIEVDPPQQPEPPPPEAEEEEEIEEEDPLEPMEEAPEAEAPPPEAAEVGEALTAEPDPDAPLDLTGDQWTMVTGPGTRFAGGASQRGGKSKEAIYDRKAKAGGDPTVKRTTVKPGKTKKKKKDQSRPATLTSGTSWNSCGFPAEAEMGQIDYARVVLVVTVGPSGKPQRVAVVSETPPGFGFGALAQSCAYRKSFKPGLDRDGNPTTSTTPSIGVTFTR
jgi:protein TonB